MRRMVKLAVKVAINGFGRIGRLVLRGCIDDPDLTGRCYQ